MSTQTDINYMRVALDMARRGVGRVAPNPSVGCVLVKEEHIIARGRTAEGGRPHAEAAALAEAGSEAKGSTVYVTLEPCAHPGRGPACSDLLIEAGVSRVVIGCIDPNPDVNGQGIEKLKTAGIEVTFGVLEDECQQSNAGFLLTKTDNRPFVTLKLATSLDNKIAARIGERTQISGELAGRYMHLQRSLHDAILVGSETYLVDEPQLTTRIKGYDHNIKRFVFDRRGRLADRQGFELLNQSSISEALSYLVEQGITRLLVEGGAQLHQGFLESAQVDQFLWCKSPHEIGEQGIDAPYMRDLEAKYGLKHQKTRQLGEDTLEIYSKAQ